MCLIVKEYEGQQNTTVSASRTFGFSRSTRSARQKGTQNTRVEPTSSVGDDAKVLVEFVISEFSVSETTLDPFLSM